MSDSRDPYYSLRAEHRLLLGITRPNANMKISVVGDFHVATWFELLGFTRLPLFTRHTLGGRELERDRRRR